MTAYIFTWHRYAQTKAQALEDADGDLERAIEILSTQITESAEDENLKLGERCQGIWFAFGLMSFKPCAPTTDVGCVGMTKVINSPCPVRAAGNTQAADAGHGFRRECSTGGLATQQQCR